MPFAAKNAAPAALTHPDIFTSRHIGPNAAQISAMLKTVGAPTLDALIDETVPKGIRRQEAMHLPLASGEAEALAELQGLADRNKVYRSYLGMGYANCILPAVIRRNVLENPGWYTQYTPYQAEISQGRLEGLLSFQTLITDLTGLPVANASLLDEATAAAEAMTLIHRVVKDDNKNTFFVARDCHPQVIEVVRTRAEPLGITILVGDHRELTFPVTLFGALLQYPATDGAVRDYSEFVSKAHAVGAKVAVATELLALCLLIPPGEWDADIAVGNSQRFGVPLGYGGPHAAFMACKEEFRRQLPGRIVGVSKDTHGRPALRLALQTREQHIRREKATSNICTAQALLANMAAFYAIYHGPAGLRAIAERLRRLTAALANGLGTLGFTYGPTVFVDTLRVDVPDQMPTLRLAAEARCINLRAIDAHTIGIALDETTTLNDVSDLLDIFNGGEAHGLDIEALAVSVPALPENLVRKTSYLQHAVFNRYHSETEMMRYLKRLEGRDLSLTNSMIPLGSCTMKLNAASEMLPVTWNGFANIHPFAPVDQTEGYQVMFRQLEDWLSEITGFAGCSLQPNAGSQGEYAGLLVIRAWHHSRGQGHRDICLIPTSAHGTNPATASMAGLSVIAVACDAQGNIDLKDLAAKAVQYKDCLACLMVTYPSTHGVFEEGIVDICRIVHEYGGQVYMDGANMNAQVGLTAPGVVGADVCHLNLHKTFCIPHGGGGPGMGPICVARHLVPFLPKHSVVDLRGDRILGAVSAAPWGSSLILTISWMYIRMMGAKGLTDATKIAILNANYIAKRLEGRYPVLYTGRNGRVAHECIIDVRQLKAGSGVDVEDIAKRLMDYGFHAPTVSFPVPGTLMIEPTESESQSELDRFCDAMISIHAEIQAIIDGKADKDNNLLHHAPHTLADICSDTWDRPYGREQAAFPLPYVREQKFWPSVNRIDGAYGDRNPVCTCVGMDAYTP